DHDPRLNNRDYFAMYACHSNETLSSALNNRSILSYRLHVIATLNNLQKKPQEFALLAKTQLRL
ncbi:MAG: hypothetical protein LBG48_04500, partial [Rickettsiales bacterium]|nr:hypothetical protein [Rickettsiales bacterium]